MKKKIFKEKQQFRSKEIIILISLFILLIFNRLANEIISGDGSYFNEIVCLFLLLGIGIVIYFLYQIEMKVRISKDDIRFKMTPWQSKYHKIRWRNVNNCSIVQTSPLAEWHGSNISFCNEKRFTLSGNNGISLTTKDGKKYFIGSRKLEELEQAIQLALSKKEK